MAFLVCSTNVIFEKHTGNVPGVEASKNDTAVLAGADGLFAAPENNLLFERI